MALKEEGYNAVVERVGTDLTAGEIRYAFNRMPIVVRFGTDMVDDPDLCDFEFWQFVERLQKDGLAYSSTGSSESREIFGGKKMVHFYRDAVLAKLTGDAKNIPNVRRFVYIHTLEGVDEKALQTIVRVVRTQANAI